MILSEKEHDEMLKVNIVRDDDILYITSREFEKAKGLKGNRETILKTLLTEHIITLSKLSEKTEIPLSTVSDNLSKLRRLGLVAKYPDGFTLIKKYIRLVDKVELLSNGERTKVTMASRETFVITKNGLEVQ